MNAGPTHSEEYVFAPPAVVSLPIQGSDLRFPVRRIYCVGRNYADHVREMGGDVREPPFFFQKPTDSIVESQSDLPYPCFTADFQHEVELVLAIGRGGARINREDAAQYVFATAVGIDLTRRDVQIGARKSGRPWEVGKSFDRSAACSALRPLLGKLPERGLIVLDVNRERRQTGDLSQMIWTCDEIVAQLSVQYRLEPGDLIYTGTPAGVGPMHPGDQVTACIDGVGEIALRVMPSTEVAKQQGDAQ